MSARELPPVPMTVDSAQEYLSTAESITGEDDDEYDYPYAYPTGIRAKTSEYESVLSTTKDKDNFYLQLTPSTKTKEETNSVATAKTDPTLPTDLLELTVDHLAKVDPRQTQLWMLLQIQKVVQKMEKMEDMYESAGYLRPPSPLPPTVIEGKQPPPVVQNNPNQPTRKDIYVNLSGITQEKGIYKPLPPIPPPPDVPPKTYKDVGKLQILETSQVSEPAVAQCPYQSETQAFGGMKLAIEQKMIGKTRKCDNSYFPETQLCVHLHTDTLVARSITLGPEIVEQLVISIIILLANH